MRKISNNFINITENKMNKIANNLTKFGFISALLLIPGVALTAATSAMFNADPTSIFGIRWEIIIFAATLVGIGIFYKNTTDIAIIGATSMIAFKIMVIPDFTIETLSSPEYIDQYINLINLAGLLLGFNILADLFLKSNVPYKIPKILPNNYWSGFILLCLIFVLSSFLDNIAAALIGYATAYAVYNKKVHFSYIIALVAAANGGGAGSVVGDTATTMFWISGIPPTKLIGAFIPSIIALIIFGLISSKLQYKYSSSIIESDPSIKIDWIKFFLVFFVLASCIISNAILHFPSIGIWIALYLGKFFTKIDWKLSPENFSSIIFLLILVFTADLIPISGLPEPSDKTVFAIGAISSILNNIPLAQLCIEQGGYNWALLSFAVGFGGSLMWFGSSAGVAVCDQYPKIRSLRVWLKYGWPVYVAYIVSFWAYSFVS